jgi:hypothetical protein
MFEQPDHRAAQSPPESVNISDMSAAVAEIDKKTLNAAEIIGVVAVFTIGA